MLPPCNHFSYTNLLSTFANPPNRRKTLSTFANPPIRPSAHPSAHPFLRNQPLTLLSARVPYERQSVFKVFDFIELALRSQKNHPQNPSVKSMALPALATTMRKCNQSVHRIPCNDRAAHRAIQRQRSASRKYNQSAEVRAYFGISTGLINQNYWENSKWYYGTKSSENGSGTHTTTSHNTPKTLSEKRELCL